MTLFKPPIPWEQMPHEVSENWTASAPFLARDESSRQMLMSKSEFTRVYEFPVEEEVVRFIMWTSRGHDWGPLPDFPGAIVLRRQVSVGGFRRHELALAGTLSALFTRFWGVSGRKWVRPALRWANNKKKNTKAICRSPSANKGGVRLFVCNSTCDTEDTYDVLFWNHALARLFLLFSFSLSVFFPLLPHLSSPLPPHLTCSWSPRSVSLCVQSLFSLVCLSVRPVMFPCRAVLFCVSCFATSAPVSPPVSPWDVFYLIGYKPWDFTLKCRRCPYRSDHSLFLQLLIN